MDLLTMLDIAQGVGALLAMLATAIGTIWLFFRKQLRRWWTPYKKGIEGMSEVPGLKESVELGRGEVQVLGQRIALIDLMVRARGDINIETAEFECNELGEYTYVNQTYARWLGVGKEELMRHGWVNFVLQVEREEVRREWALCQHEHRIYNRRVTFVDINGERNVFDVIATPIPSVAPAKKWIGVMRRVVV